MLDVRGCVLVMMVKLLLVDLSWNDIVTNATEYCKQNFNDSC